MKKKLPDLNEIVFTATRSSGPGGQNVNKVSSAAVLNWHVMESQSYTEESKILINEKLSQYINKQGFLYLKCNETRDLERNKKICLQKLKDLLAFAFFKPKKRIKTRPTFSSKIKRVDSKKQRGETKKNRKKVDY